METWLDNLTCLMCTNLVTTPAFSCSFGHLHCSTCYHYHKDNICIYCATANKLTECQPLSSVLENVALPCPHKGDDCPYWVSMNDYASHAQTCLYAKHFCAACSIAQSDHDDQMLLRLHMMTHGPLYFTYNDILQLENIVPGRHLLLESINKQDYYLLVINEAGISLQHMPWGAEAPYMVSVRSGRFSHWRYQGVTFETMRNPNDSPPILLKLPQAVYEGSVIMLIRIADPKAY